MMMRNCEFILRENAGSWTDISEINSATNYFKRDVLQKSLASIVFVGKWYNSFNL